METPPEEPSSKKLKPSPTHKTPKYKRRKIALFFAYCGVGYQGMQKNIGAKTIEADLEQALFLSGAIPEQDKDHPKRFDWSRSARTDKGVSAVCQVVSGSFYIDPPGLIDRLHQHLCSQFRVFGFKRVTPSFNAQRFCDRRRYVYLLPVFALDEKCVVVVRSGILSNNDGVEGECDVAVCSGILSNNDSVEGECDVAVRSGILSNNDGVEGECDVAVRSGILSNNDSVEGECDVAVRSGILSNNDGVEGECDVAVRSGILSNNDGVEGECDVAVCSGILSNNDSVEGECVVVVRSGILSNNDGVEGECDVAVRSGILSNNDSVEGECDVAVRSGILSNNDGVEGECDVAVRSGILSNNDGVEGECDVAVRSGILSNNDSVEGECDVAVRSGILLNNDGVEGGCEGNRVSYGGEVKERFNRILKCYEGTHNFHNFTTRIKAEDPSSQRFIVSFSANETVIVDGIEFVKCEVVGQSFMLHQIRKLIGFAGFGYEECCS
ncbi:tRNA pseudouridine synthase A [Heracleum sosnowskyi]|uniref:tRNA pseudouridine synthase n=1 Tax=Heracleum sosnowskyi TaxID=360622 RepID=A0AAD8J9S4_9APIA|nr:tRNA pseudouridine synthase A [Heracleum sosnowskyi]